MGYILRWWGLCFNGGQHEFAKHHVNNSKNQTPYVTLLVRTRWHFYLTMFITLLSERGGHWLTNGSAVTKAGWFVQPYPSEEGFTISERLCFVDRTLPGGISFAYQKSISWSFLVHLSLRSLCLCPNNIFFLKSKVGCSQEFIN